MRDHVIYECHAFCDEKAWKGRSKAEKRIDPTCRICGERSTQVHHILYTDNKHEPSEHLLAVCDACHELCEQCKLRPYSREGTALQCFFLMAIVASCRLMGRDHHKLLCNPKLPQLAKKLSGRTCPFLPDGLPRDWNSDSIGWEDFFQAFTEAGMQAATPFAAMLEDLHLDAPRPQ